MPHDEWPPSGLSAPLSGAHLSGLSSRVAKGSRKYLGPGTYHPSTRWWMSAAAASRKTAGSAGM
eukprot:11910198-Alexandrium_andersonii.AAC.1